ncbi:unnamed protein product [Moneuplotes crassus]|uniref:Palmitoyltransferase n=1 Tax=Euplotes crassus TaxID=5936 RepID=A0AAD1X5D8_EUPCR|nr:unnamed protein product [Moneuplotes crassus]
MCDKNYASNNKKYGLIFTVLIVILPVIVLHFLNLYHYFITRGEISNSYRLAIDSLKVALLFTHIICCCFLYLTLPWTRRMRIFSKIQLHSKMSKGARDSIISKDPFQRNIKYRFYIDGKITFLKGCRVCRIIRPPRTAHCYKCGYCVKTLDHHCLWLSCCIGEGNYAYFCTFLTSLNLVFILTILLNTLLLFCENSSSKIDYRQNFVFSPYAILYIILSIPVLCFIFPLLCFHIYLIMNNKTTYEYYKAKETKSENMVKQQVIKIPVYNIRNASSATIANLNYCDQPQRCRKVNESEKVALCSKVNEDLIAEYGNVEAPPTDRFFDTYGGTREETKQSLNYRENKRTTRENVNTDSSLNDVAPTTKMNMSNISDNSVRMKEIHTTDSMEINSNKLKLNLKICPQLKDRKNRRSGQRRNESTNLQISSLLKRKGQNRNIDNFLSIKESKEGENSRPGSPYFSTSKNNLKSNLQREQSQISDNPLASATAFQINLAQGLNNDDLREEIKIMDGDDLLETPKANNMTSKLNRLEKEIFIQTAQSSLKTRNKEVSPEVHIAPLERKRETTFIIPEQRNNKINYKGRQNIFEESVRAINSISIDRKSSKTPELEEDAYKSNKHNSLANEADSKIGSRKMSFGVVKVSDTLEENFDSIEVDKPTPKNASPKISPDDTHIIFAAAQPPDVPINLREKKKCLLI